MVADPDPLTRKAMHSADHRKNSVLHVNRTFKKNHVLQKKKSRFFIKEVLKRLFQIGCIVPVELFLYRERLQQQNGDLRKRDRVESTCTWLY
jgi:hypothetical protein